MIQSALLLGQISLLTCSLRLRTRRSLMPPVQTISTSLVTLDNFGSVRGAECDKFVTGLEISTDILKVTSTDERVELRTVDARSLFCLLIFEALSLGRVNMLSGSAMWRGTWEVLL